MTVPSRRASARLLAAAGVAVGVAAVGAAAAAPSESPEPLPLGDVVELRDPLCLDAHGLTTAIGRYLGRTTVDGRIHVTVRETPRDVLITAQRGEDSFERPLAIPRGSCAERRAGIPLGVAMMIEALLLPPPAPPPPARPSAAPPAPPSAAPPAPSAAPPATTARPAAEGQAPPPARRRLGLSAAIAVDGLVNVMPGLAVGVAPSLDLRLAELVDLEAFFLGTTAAAVEIGPHSAQVSLLAGGLAACLARRGAPLQVRGCAGVAAGAVRAEGNDFSPTFAQGPWVAVRLGIDARWAFTEHIGLVASLEGYLPVVRPRLDLVVANQQLVASQPLPLAGASLGVGPSVIFW